MSLIENIRRYQSASNSEEKVCLAEEFIRLVRPELWAYVLCRCPSDLAEDTCQEVLTAIALGLDSLRGQSEREIWQWCYRIAAHKIADQLRRLKRQRGESLDLMTPEEVWKAMEISSATQPISPAEQVALQDAVNQLNALKPPCKDILVSFYIFDMDYSELARQYKVSYETMRKRVKRCFEAAQAYLRKIEEPPSYG